MSAHDRSAHAVISSRLVVELEEHGPEARALIETWLDMDRYGRLSSSVDRMARYCGAVPQLLGPWTDVLTSHAELIQCAWETGRQGGQVANDPAVAALLRVHLNALNRARETALWVINHEGRPR